MVNMGAKVSKLAAESLSSSKAVMDQVERCGWMKQTGVSLKYMMDFGSTPSPNTLLLSAQFLHKELPVRIARRVIDLETLPYGLSLKPAVLKVPVFSFLYRPSICLQISSIHLRGCIACNCNDHRIYAPPFSISDSFVFFFSFLILCSLLRCVNIPPFLLSFFPYLFIFFLLV